jgi:hypothetical protein
MRGRWGERGSCLAYFVKAKGGCFRSQNHRPKGRVSGGSSRAKKRQAPFGLGENQGNGDPLKKDEDLGS